MVNKLELSKDPNPKLFYHALEALGGLEESKVPELVFYQFIWKWLEGAGFYPQATRNFLVGATLKF